MASLQFAEMAGPPAPILKKQLLPHLVDGQAITRPLATWAEYPISPTGYDQGFQKLKWSDFANTVNGVAWWLHKTLGPGENFPTLAYIGPNDLRYNALTLGAVKAGYKMLYLSPRNSMVAHAHLIKVTDCKTMLAPSPEPPFVTAIFEACPVRRIGVPAVEELLSKRHPHFPYAKTYQRAKKEPLVVMHSSGTTGLPKPVVWTHEFAANFHHWNAAVPDHGYGNLLAQYAGVRFFIPMPPFHAAYFFTGFLNTIQNCGVVIHPPAGVIPSAEIVANGLKHTKADLVFMAPPFVEEAAKKPEVLDVLAKNLDAIFFAGGDVSIAAGEIIHPKMRIWTGIGATEFGTLPSRYPSTDWPREDWKYIDFAPGYGYDFQHVSDDLHEMVIKRCPDEENVQPIFTIYPELREYRTSDLYTAHPTKPGLWTYRGRNDDIVVFLTGEKTNPVTMEQKIAGHPDVAATLVVGTLRFQAALLIELKSRDPMNSPQKAVIIEKLWPTIQAANVECPQHARIAKSHILLADPARPMERSGKGTIQRRPTLEIYAMDVDALYADADKMDASKSMAGPAVAIDFKNKKAMSDFIREAVSDLVNDESLKDTDDLFIKGALDSLAALQLTRILKQTFDAPELDITTIYTSPSIARLTETVIFMLGQHKASKSVTAQMRHQILRSMVEEYSMRVDDIAAAQTDKHTNPRVLAESQTVVLTGSTGALGSYILGTLLDDPQVTHVFCLNRASDSHHLQKERNVSRGLSTSFPEDKVTFLTADLAAPDLGLDPSVYTVLIQRSTHIIHNAWPVNFNLTLASFQPALLSVLNLLTLTTHASYQPTILFLSSISSVSALPGLVPEEIITDLKAPIALGYAEAKFLAEYMLNYAAGKMPLLSVAIARIGQVAGPVNTDGIWNGNEWIPSLVISSLHLGLIPETLFSNDVSRVDWVPIDLLAEILVDISLQDRKSIEPGKAKVYHPLNPKPTTWQAILPAISEALSSTSTPRKEIRSVPLPDWLRALRTEAECLQGVEEVEKMIRKIPAIKLLAFFDGLVGKKSPTLETGSASISKRYAALEGCRDDWVQKWVRGWMK